MGLLITRRRRLPSTEQLPPVVDVLRALVPELSKELLKGGVRVKKARWNEGGTRSGPGGPSGVWDERVGGAFLRHKFRHSTYGYWTWESRVMFRSVLKPASSTFHSSTPTTTQS